jgi:hypothetical protein
LPLLIFGETEMIELDNGPVALAMIIAIAFLAPAFYSFFVDRNNKK